MRRAREGEGEKRGKEREKMGEGRGGCQEGGKRE